MLFNLVGKELKHQFKSITFYLFFLVVVLFYITQFAPIDTKSSLKPEPPSSSDQNSINRSYYGTVHLEDPKTEIENIYEYMSMELRNGEILSYKMVIGKHVKLSKDDKMVIRNALHEIAPNGYKNGKLQIEITYKRFKELADSVDKKLGGSTMYSSSQRKILNQRQKTYDEAISEFNEVVEKDKLTNAYGRLFADYLGVTAGFFPIFLAAFVLTRDKRSGIHELIYSRSISSYVYVFAKFIALAIASFICYLLIAGHATFVFEKIAAANSYTIDHFAFFKYALIWIFPTVLFTISVGMLISTLFSSGIVAIPIQFVLWMTSLMPLKGEYQWYKSMIRFNTVGDHGDYLKWVNNITLNRIFFVILSIAITFLTSYIWSLKRGAGIAKASKFTLRNKIQH